MSKIDIFMVARNLFLLFWFHWYVKSKVLQLRYVSLYKLEIITDYCTAVASRGAGGTGVPPPNNISGAFGDKKEEETTGD